MTSKSKIVKKSIISKERIQKYKKPNQTERQGLIMSRVGQGFSVNNSLKNGVVNAPYLVAGI